MPTGVEDSLALALLTQAFALVAAVFLGAIPVLIGKFLATNLFAGWRLKRAGIEYSDFYFRGKEATTMHIGWFETQLYEKATGLVSSPIANNDLAREVVWIRFGVKKHEDKV